MPAELKQELEKLPDGADDKAREINGKLEVIQRRINELEGALRGTPPGPREGEGDRGGRRNASGPRECSAT